MYGSRLPCWRVVKSRTITLVLASLVTKAKSTSSLYTGSGTPVDILVPVSNFSVLHVLRTNAFVSYGSVVD